MARIKTYAIDATPTIEDKVIGTNVDDANLTQNYKIGDIIALVPGGLSSVQSLNTLTGVVNLVAGTNISLAVDASKKEIEISSTGGAGGITSIDGATGPAIDLVGKGGITVTAVGNLINIDGSGIGGGNPALPDFGVQYNQGGAFGAGEFFKVDLSAKLNPTVNIGNLSGETPIKGQLNIFSGSGDVSPFGEVRWYDFLGSGNYASWASPGRVEKSYAVALPASEPTSIDQVLAIQAVTTGPNSPAEAVWKTISSGGTGKFKMEASDASEGFWRDKVFTGTGITQTFLTDKDGNITVQLNGSSVSTVNTIKVGSSTAQGTFEFTGSGVTMTNGGAGEPQNIINFDYQDTLVSGTNIKTINSQSILGSGDIVVSGGTPAGVAGSVQISDGTNFSADTNLTWDTTNNILTIGNENNPVFQEGILLLKGNGSNLGGRVQFQTGIGKASAAIVTLQAPEAGTRQEISLPGALPSDVGLALTVKSITGTEVETEWKAAGGGGGTVTSVGGTAPIASSGGNTPSISISESSESVNGYLSSTNFTAFKGKQAALVSGTNIKSINGNSLLGSGDLTIGSSATPGGSNTQIQYNNNNVLDGNVGLTLDTGTAGVTKVQIGKSDDPTFRYGVLRLEGNSSTEGGKIELETGASKGSPETIILQAPDSGVAQEISLPESLPTADTQILGIKSISGTSVQTQWETPTGGGGAVSQIIAGDNISVTPSEGTGAVTVNVTGISVPKSYIATFTTSGGVATPNVLNNDTGGTFTWTDTRLGQINIGLSGIPDGARIWVMVNGYGASKEEGKIQCFFGGYSGKATLIIDKLNERFLVEDTDIVAGNIEIRIY